MSTPKDLKYFFSGSILLGFSSVYSLLIPLIIIPYIIGVVGLGNYGLSVIAFSTTFFLSLIVDYGYNISGVNSISKSKMDIEKSSIIIKAFHTKAILFIITIALFSLSVFVAPYLRDNIKLFLFSLFIPLSSVFNLNWALQGLQMIKELSLITVLNKTVYLIGVFWVIKQPEDYIYINFIFGLGVLITGVLSFFLIKKKIKILWVSFRYFEFLKELSGSTHYFVSNISLYISTNLYPILLNLFVSNEIVGVFAAIEKIYNVLRAPFSIYINLMLPRVSRLMEESIRKGIQLVKKTYIFVGCFIVILIALVWSFQEPLIEYFVKDYVLLSRKLLHIALFGLFLVIFNCPVYLLLLALDEKKLIMKAFLLIPLIGILSCLPLAKFYGAEGVFYSIVLVELLYVVFLNKIFYDRRNVPRERT
ncbi:oligosaccharide flippase family protein [uncultured Aquimarina sp.]|uniref:oligosaccharide flippase family protein n=1 Tax=uncultured Aquimarina sp. TaxID=575652 RepID=UPI002602365D|nr:oligosaccharide flippase family protein [uncultured Aquimarina sp.]